MTNGKLTRNKTIKSKSRKTPHNGFSAPAEQVLEDAFEGFRRFQEKVGASRLELARTNAILLDQNDQFRELFESSPDGYVITDGFGAIREANRAALELFHLPRGFAYGKPLSYFFGTEDRREIRRKLLTASKFEQVEPWEARLKPYSSNGLILVSVKVFALAERREAAFGLGLGWIIRDIRQQVSLIDQLRTSEGVLAQRNRELEGINELTQAVGTSLNLEVILKKAEQVMSIKLRIPAGAVFLYEPSGIGLKTSWGLSEAEQTQLAIQDSGDKPTPSAAQALLDFDPSVQVSLVGLPSALNTFTECLLIKLQAHGQAQGFIYLYHNQPLIGDERQVALYRIVGQQLVAAIANAHLYQQSQQRQAQLQAVTQQLVEAQEIERRAVARELHDEIGQALTGLKLFLEIVQGQRASIDKAILMLNELIAQVRDMSLNLRPSMLDDLGLLPTLLWYFRRYTDQTGIRVVFDHAGIQQRLNPEVETAAYRIVQEALTNVARHAQVDVVTVDLRLSGGRLNISIDDQGQGFDPAEIRGSYRTAGLSGMMERATGLGGKLSIESQPGGGVHIFASLPFNTSR